MRTPEYRSPLVLAFGAMLFAGQGLTCEPPPGFVNPPRPEIASNSEMLPHVEEIVVTRPIESAARSANRPLQEAIGPTKDLPGVSGTFRLSEGPYATPGARRLVCLTDGNFAVEELLVNETVDGVFRFRYLVWNYTSPKFRDVDHAVGEFVRTAPAPDKTHVHWVYRFKLKDGLSAEQQDRFRKTFLDGIFAEWMRTQLERGRAHAESTRP